MAAGQLDEVAGPVTLRRFPGLAAELNSILTAPTVTPEAFAAPARPTLIEFTEGGPT